MGDPSPLPRSTSNDSVYVKCGPEELSPRGGGNSEEKPQCRMRNFGAERSEAVSARHSPPSSQSGQPQAQEQDGGGFGDI